MEYFNYSTSNYVSAVLIIILIIIIIISTAIDNYFANKK